MAVEKKGSVAVAWLKGTKHRFYEDRYRILNRRIPIVRQSGRGELFAVFDGIGSAPKGMQAAQAMCDALINFYEKADLNSPSWETLQEILYRANLLIYEWGNMPNSERPLGGCAGTIIWVVEDTLFTFHAGDTSAMLLRDGKHYEITQSHQTPDGAIFRYFGIGPSLKMTIEALDIEESDRILLLSDGVTKVFDPPDIGRTIEEQLGISAAVQELARMSQLKGSTDDITAMLVEIDEIWEH